VIIPILIKYSFHATFFVLTRVINENQKNYITWDQLKAWEQTGLIEIGSHGVNHPDYRKITAAEIRRDAKTSKNTIEAKLGHPITFLAYPYDSIPDRPALLLKPLGYHLAIGGYRRERSVLFNDFTPYALPSYYPYSGPKTYPVITGARGLTFGQMIEKAVAAQLT
jgi:peptidoglycan/xylan/chitin deacetylase (PgdA/CDA1 family)